MPNDQKVRYESSIYISIYESCRSFSNHFSSYGPYIAAWYEMYDLRTKLLGPTSFPTAMVNVHSCQSYFLKIPPRWWATFFRALYATLCVCVPRSVFPLSYWRQIMMTCRRFMLTAPPSLNVCVCAHCAPNFKIKVTLSSPPFFPETPDGDPVWPDQERFRNEIYSMTHTFSHLCIFLSTAGSKMDPKRAPIGGKMKALTH